MLTLTPKHASGSLRSPKARAQQMPACRAGALPSAPAIAFGTGRPLHSSDRLPPMHYFDSWKQSADSDTERGQRAGDGPLRGEPAIKLLD